MISIKTNVHSLEAQPDLDSDQRFHDNAEQLTSGGRIHKNGNETDAGGFANSIQSESGT